MSTALSGAFDALEHELSLAARRLTARTARRRRGAVAALLVVLALAVTGTASGILHVPISREDDPTANHAASAMGLSAEEAAVLLRAQQLGQIVNACLRAHGAQAINGGFDDPSGEATRACKSESDANEAFLDSPAFRSAEHSMLPRIMQAARCLQEHTGVEPGTMIGEDGKRPPQAVLDAGSAACFTPEGLPK